MAEAQGKLIQHLGIVSGICDEIELAKSIDAHVQKNKRKVSVGTAVQAMILNALGFTGRALYLTPEFFRTRPVDVLLGPEVRPEDLHDDCLGTALDALYESGVTELFYDLASHALRIFDIEHRFVHLDSTTFSLHGAYREDEDEGQEGGPEVISITKGYSRDSAPDLNQVVVSLMCAYRSSIPVWIEALSGNASDKVSFRRSIAEYRKQFQAKQLPFFVADSALYSKENFEQLKEVKWVTRVPETLKEAKQWISQLQTEMMSDCGDGYHILVVPSSYGGVPQRWILVFSEQACKRELETFTKNLAVRTEEAVKELWHLQNRAFACEADARKEAKRFSKSLRYHSIAYQLERKLHYGQKGRPLKNATPNGESWFIRAELQEDTAAIETAKKSKGVFIIATNELSESALAAVRVLEVYKAQSVSVERGFRFLKDPMFYAESLHLNSPKRIMALIMVMSLSLLVYSLAERKLRAVLKNTGAAISNQVGKPTDNPTIRWVFQRFEGILLITIYQDKTTTTVASNMQEDHKTIIRCLGPPYRKTYFLD
jgi:transposase